MDKSLTDTFSGNASEPDCLSEEMIIPEKGHPAEEETIIPEKGLPAEEETILRAAEEAFSLPAMLPENCSPLTLAYIGDAVFELVIRTAVVRRVNGRLKDMNRRAIEAVSARAQSEMVNVIEPMLTEEEKAVYKRGRNANSPTMAKHASVSEYRRATGLEALMGYLYLKGENRRIAELIRAAYPQQ